MKVYILKQNIRQLEKEYTYFPQITHNGSANPMDMNRLSGFNSGKNIGNKF